ncbi:hypothetical protein RGQ15_19730 [Paracoccus sp. MBLB3053]|uniref:Peroxidase n=1 Tax=Paracoccus aurantius TaxID=3073814 RepID=A0ABU2HXM4_9RHOB|nr:hypothetical protein [Paracoccus sp. MBLB3053]MDS9469793.1 hypothetical protein [Paracoccus sp. MBLB3053]
MPAVDFADIQGLARFGHGRLRAAEFLLLEVAAPDAARAWLRSAPLTTAQLRETPPQTALQVALTADGLRALGITEATVSRFPQPFLAGMAGEASRSRRLGDVGDNDPLNWQWGRPAPHVLLMLYAAEGGLDALMAELRDTNFDTGFRVMRRLPTGIARGIEPFGFVDGVSEPVIDWDQTFTTDLHRRLGYANMLAPGELLLGYPNEYQETAPAVLAEAAPGQRATDLARNGSFLVLRQLHQDVRGFWQYLDRVAGADPAQRDRLASLMVGRHRDGRGLIPDHENIPGGRSGNNFTYSGDVDGNVCPVGAHIRRANPRTGDHPAGVSGRWSWLMSTLGFRRRRDGLAGRHDLVASSRFHRLVRRGREYGSRLSVDEALLPGPDEERGILFVCLCADIVRQFEFVQEAWLYSARFDGLGGERDPLTGARTPLPDGTMTDHYSAPRLTGLPERLEGLPQFVTVRGGAYFFMPGIRALQFIAGA